MGSRISPQGSTVADKFHLAMMKKTFYGREEKQDDIARRLIGQMD